MSSTKLTPKDRREVVLRALQGESITALSREFDVARSWIYHMIDEAKANAAAAYADAQDDIEFRRQVLELVRGGKIYDRPLTEQETKEAHELAAQYGWKV